jgi:hypothetical protein
MSFIDLSTWYSRSYLLVVFILKRNKIYIITKSIVCYFRLHQYWCS